MLRLAGLAVALLLIVWWLKHAKRMLPLGDPERFPETGIEDPRLVPVMEAFAENSARLREVQRAIRHEDVILRWESVR